LIFRDTRYLQFFLSSNGILGTTTSEKSGFPYKQPEVTPKPE